MEELKIKGERVLDVVNTHLDKIIGFTVEEACVNIRRSTGMDDLHIRVVEEDGQSIIVFLDYRIYRINVAVKDGVISQFKDIY